MTADIEKWVSELGLAYQKHENVVMIPYESTVIAIRTVDWKPNLNLLEFVAIVAIDVKPNMDLFKYALTKNAEIPIGKFTYVEKGVNALPTIYLSHALLLEKLTKEEFKEMLTTILSLADAYDEEIAKLGGGMTYREFSEKALRGG